MTGEVQDGKAGVSWWGFSRRPDSFRIELGDNDGNDEVDKEANGKVYDKVDDKDEAKANDTNRTRSDGHDGSSENGVLCKFARGDVLPL